MSIIYLMQPSLLLKQNCHKGYTNSQKMDQGIYPGPQTFSSLLPIKADYPSNSE
jgi:hypothetical protein